MLQPSSLFLFLLLLFTHVITVLSEPPSSSKIHPFVPQNAASLYALLQKGQTHRQELIQRKDQLYAHLQQVQDLDTSHLYQLVGVQLDDFVAFESLVFGMLGVYTNTVDDTTTFTQQRWYDYRSPALRLTYDFQLAIKASHDRTRSTPWTQLKQWATQQQKDNNSSTIGTYAPHHQHQSDEGSDQGESIQALLHSMLQEVSDTADQLEKDMHQHNIQFAGGHLETVFKVDDPQQQQHSNNSSSSPDGHTSNNNNNNGNNGVGDDNPTAGEGASIVTLIDQDQNEYIMTRPADTTVIYEDMQFLHDVILILVVSFFFGLLFSFVGLPAFFGYILAGILTGPSGYDMIKELIQTETLAQLGVVLIVFVLGLECSLEKLKSMWRVALCGVTMILLVTIAVFILMGLLLGTTIKEAVFVGACVNLSSTAVVVKVIPIEQLGEHLYGLLVMQDVLLGFMLALVPAMAKSGLNVMAKAVLHVSLSFLVFAAMCVGLMRVVLPSAPRLVRHLVPPSLLATVVHNLSQYHHELILLGALAICLVMSVVSESLGLGMELGCFAAGVVIRSISTEPSSSQHHHHQHHHHQHNTASSLLLTVITPVRDLFSCLFFASIGLHVYPSFLASELMLLLILTTMVMGFKYLVTTGVLVSMNTFDLRACSSMSVALAQISEFAFVLASRAKQLHIISREVYYLLLAVTALTLMATPVLWKLTHTNHQHGDDTSSDADKVA